MLDHVHRQQLVRVPSIPDSNASARTTSRPARNEAAAPRRPARGGSGTRPTRRAPRRQRPARRAARGSDVQCPSSARERRAAARSPRSRPCRSVRGARAARAPRRRDRAPRCRRRSGSATARSRRRAAPRASPTTSATVATELSVISRGRSACRAWRDPSAHTTSPASTHAALATRRDRELDQFRGEHGLHAGQHRQPQPPGEQHDRRASHTPTSSRRPSRRSSSGA